MTQNTSSAVMARRAEPHDSLDFFPTPPWATRALCEWLADHDDLARRSAWEPACGAGDMARPLREFFASVRATDVFDYGWGQDEVDDFLMFSARESVADWIVTNPPFRLGAEFVRTALDRCRVGAAMLVRTAFLEGVSRREELFGPHPPLAVLQFVERVPMHKGKLTATGSTATAYCWIVWRKEPALRTMFDWLGPCRRRLERPGDYDGGAA